MYGLKAIRGGGSSSGAGTSPAQRFGPLHLLVALRAPSKGDTAGQVLGAAHVEPCESAIRIIRHV